MTTIVFIQPDGTRREVDAKAGESGMQAAVRAGVDGIVGECGGACMCATCHVQVSEDDNARIGAREAIEEEMLESVLDDVSPASRLSCQIRLRPDLEGLVLRVVEVV